MRDFTEAIEYLLDNYRWDWEQGFVTDDVYEWLEAKENALAGADLESNLLKAIDEYSTYEEERDEFIVSWDLDWITRFEVSSLIKTLLFVLQELEAEEEDDDILRGKLLAIRDITSNEFIGKKAKEKADELGYMVIEV